MFTMCNAALNACWDTATARATKLNNDSMIKFGDVHYQIKFINFPKETLSTTTPISARVFFQQLTCSVAFSFWKACVKMSVFVCKRHFWRRQIWRHLHVAMLQCWTKFSNVLVCWRIRMIRAKNYETTSTLSKLYQKIPWPFFRTRCITLKLGH